MCCCGCYSCFCTSVCGDENDPHCGTSPRSKCWCQWDLCGWICAIVTYFLMSYGWYATVFHVLRPWRGAWSFHEVLFSMFMMLAFWSHCKGQFTDPGTIPPLAKPISPGTMPNDMPMCQKCRAYKPPHAHHCSICNRCVSRMDHHCPWLNSCVGASNLKLFLLFCFYIFVVSTYALILTIAKTLSCASYGKEHSVVDFALVTPHYCRGQIHTTLIIIFLSVECIIFGLFTLCMICDQYGNISTGESHVDKLKLSAADKAKRARVRTWKDNLSTVFGDGGFSIWWFIPLDPKWKRPELILEYILIDGVATHADEFTDVEHGGIHAVNDEGNNAHEVAITAYDHAHPKPPSDEPKLLIV